MTNTKLNLPEYQFTTRVNSNDKLEIFDEFRKAYVIITPEEWVRQNFLKYLKEEKNYPQMLIAVEKGIRVNNMQKRFDAVVYNRNGKPIVLIEFKSPNIKLSQKVLEQISRYNLNLNVRYLIISNGLVHLCYFVDKEKRTIRYLDDVPDFSVINNRPY